MPSLTTFVFTDLVGSVDLKRQMPGSDAALRDEAYVRLVLTPHRQRIEEGLTDLGGRVVSTAGDGHFLAFDDTVRAAQWAIRVQQRHTEEPVLAAEKVAVRIGMHVGAPQVDPADPYNFIGRVVDYAARLADCANAGQVLASRSAASLLEDAGLDHVRLHSHGGRRLRGIGEVEVHEVLYDSRAPSAPRQPRGEAPAREWTVLPATMGLTEYVASGSGGTASAAIAPSTRLGNYELLERIGSGGMGNVYKARHTLFDRIRAVKLIKPELVASGGDSVVRRFYQEVKATGALEHPNLVVAIDSSSPEDEQHYLVMEYLDGACLDRVVAAEGPLAVGDACEIARQAALGLEHLHRQKLVHRDVKPSNLMLTLVDQPQDLSDPATGAAPASQRVVAKLLDLGLALLVGRDQGRVTRLDQGGMGTGYYMSPEQWRTTTVDIRADIYSLGCTLHHLLSGRPPYADSDLRPEKAHERERVPPIVRADPPPRELTALVARMMAKQAEDRPQTPLEVAQALAPFAEGHRLGVLLDRHRGNSALRRTDPADTRGAARGSMETHIPPQRGLRTPTGSTLSPRSRWTMTLTVLGLSLIAAVALGWIALERHRQIIAGHERHLKSTSQQVASNVALQIENRIGRLKDLCKQESLLRDMKGVFDDPDNRQAWAPLQDWIVRQKSEKDGEFRSSSWFLTNHRGVQIARAPMSLKSLGKGYAHRDYFHGQGRDFDKNDQSALPITTSRQSAVYRSTSKPELKVAFSVPVLDKQQNVLGVLAMSVSLGQFTALAKADEQAEQSGSPVEILLIDTREDHVDAETGHGLVLYHKRLKRTPGHSFRLPETVLDRITAPPSVNQDRMLPSYDDLFGRKVGQYWGAYAPVVIDTPGESRQTDWVVVAQEPAL